MPTPAPALPPRTRPVRLTVDVSPALYAALLQFQQELTIKRGRKISGQDVQRAALRRAIHDPAARAQLERDLEGQ